MPHGFAQDSLGLSKTNKYIEDLARLNDTAALFNLFTEVNDRLRRDTLFSGDKNLLQYRILETRYLINYSKIAIDSGLQRYDQLQTKARKYGHHDLEAHAFGRMANASRSKRQLGKAFEYNQKEIVAARKSGDSLLVGRALITELDILYNSLPWPVRNEDLQPLIDQGIVAIDYATNNKLQSIVPFGQLFVSKFYIEQGDYVKADSILQGISDNEPLPVTFSKYEHLSEIAKETQNLSDYRTYTLAFKTRAYKTKRPFVALNAHNYLLDYSLQTGDTDSAGYYAQRLEQNLAEVDTTKYLDFLDISYSTLAKYFQGRDKEKELKYITYSANINKVIAIRQREAFTAVKLYKDQVADLEEANTTLSDANTFFKRNMLTLVGVSLLLISVVIWLFLKYYRSRVKFKEVHGERQKMAESVIKKNIELHNKQRVYLADLVFIKADKNYVEFHTEKKRFVDRNQLSSVLMELPPNFVQVHRSYVINKNFIKTTNSTRIILLPDIEIPLSRTYKKSLNLNL